MKENKTLYVFALVALLTVSAYFLADTVDAMIGRSLEAAPRFTTPLERGRPALEPRRELSDYSSILERGLFGEGKGPSSGPAAESSNYKLIGTIEGRSFSGAVLEDSTGQVFYRLHQKLPDGSQLIRVKRDKVTLQRPEGSTIDILVADDDKIVNMNTPGGNAGPGVKRVSDGKYMVDQREMLASTENMSQILTQARALPYMEQGKTVGFRISEISPGSIYEKIGLQNGDVIQKVNSQEVDDPAKFFQLYQGLRTERFIAIDLIRGGARQTLNYEIR
ncbi:MAG: PDZ domain-containing protein [Nitrospirae bacterium]|nr:PDZ domain-containing protein [Nitrospirota bacterium]